MILFMAEVHMLINRSKVIRYGTVALCFALFLVGHTTLRAKWLSDQEYSGKLSKAYRNCESNKHAQPSPGTTKIKGYQSYPCGNNLHVKKCSSCAFVTSSGHLYGSNKGKEIDSHDCVFRSNSAPIGSYADDVGTKTTYRTIDHSSAHVMIEMLQEGGVDEFDPNAFNSTIFLGYHMTWHGEKSEIINVLADQKNMTFYNITEERFAEMSRIYHDNIGTTGFTVWMSNGFITLQLMRDFCETIDVYGIAEADYCEHVRNGDEGYLTVPYHYYGLFENIETECWKFWSHDNGYWGHRFTEEKKLFEKWAKDWHNLTFHQPEWKSLKYSK